MTVDRALATIAMIEELKPIPDADAIEAARVRGWWVVVKKGEFALGDGCVYFEIDSMLDVQHPAFAFLEPRGVREDAEGRKGHRLRTMRLRGQLSQGLVLSLSKLLGGPRAVGEDVTDELGVWKWDPPLPTELHGAVHGGLPWWVPKTDEDRAQNLLDLFDGPSDWFATATEKIDGTSTTFWVDPTGERVEGVCGRNYDLVEGGVLWAMARQLDIFSVLRSAFPGARVVLQGELYGEGVQGNPLRVKGKHFAAFRLLVEGRGFVDLDDWPEPVRRLAVPVLDLPFPASLDEALAQAERQSAINPDRPAEGIVWSETVGGQRRSFKVIANSLLVKAKS